VAGERATEYRYLLDFSRLTAQAKSTSLFGRLAPVLGKLQLPIRLWVDAGGRPVLERAAFGYHGATIHLSVTSSYGNAVDVIAPPARLVATAPARGAGTSGTA
jgi:hypothetical protein